MKLTIALMTAFISFSAFSLTLKEKKQMEDWNNYLTGTDGYSKSVQTKCGYDIKVKLEDKFAPVFIAANANAASYCDGLRSVIANMCEDKMSKEAITKKIKSINCTLGKIDEATFKITGTTLNFAFGANTSNIEQKTKEFLENNL